MGMGGGDIITMYLDKFSPSASSLVKWNQCGHTFAEFSIQISTSHQQNNKIITVHQSLMEIFESISGICIS